MQNRIRQSWIGFIAIHLIFSVTGVFITGTMSLPGAQKVLPVIGFVLLFLYMCCLLFLSVYAGEIGASPVQIYKSFLGMYMYMAMVTSQGIILPSVFSYAMIAPFFPLLTYNTSKAVNCIFWAVITEVLLEFIVRRYIKPHKNEKEHGIRNKYLIIILTILFSVGIFVCDYGFPVSGKGIRMLKDINSDYGIEISKLDDEKNEKILINGESASLYIEQLQNNDYYRITSSSYHGSFSGSHYLVFAKTKDGHAITIELCGSEKLSITDETEKKIEYYRIR